MAVLQQNFGTPPFPTFRISDEKTTVGRQEDCDIVINSPAVSRRHAEIAREQNRYFIADLGSRNGTSLNGTKIRHRTLLKDGDSVEISTLSFIFRSQNTLSEMSGSWGVKPNVISLTGTGSDKDDSIRRQTVREGDRISGDLLGSGLVRESQLVARIQVGDGSGGWPVTDRAEVKLNHLLRLVHSLRCRISRADVLGQVLESLFQIFGSAERIAIVLRDEAEDGIQVTAAAARVPTEEIEVCLPVVRTSMQNSEAFLYVDHLRNPEAKNPDLDAPHMRSILVVPLMGLADHSIGAIQIDSNNTRQPLSRVDLEILVVAGHLLSFVIEQSTEISLQLNKCITNAVEDVTTKIGKAFSLTQLPSFDSYPFRHRQTAEEYPSCDILDYVSLSADHTGCVVVSGQEAAGSVRIAQSLYTRILTEELFSSRSPATALKIAGSRLRLLDTGVVDKVAAVTIVADSAGFVQIAATDDSAALVKIEASSSGRLSVQHVETSDPQDGTGPCFDARCTLEKDDLLVVINKPAPWLTQTADAPKHAAIVKLVEQAAAGSLTEFEDRLSAALSAGNPGRPEIDLTFVTVCGSRERATSEFRSSASSESDTCDA